MPFITVYQNLFDKLVYYRWKTCIRVLNGTKIKDKVSIGTMLKKFNLLSVNQLAAKIKLIEVWKTINRLNYPLGLVDPYKPTSLTNQQNYDLRGQTNRIFNDSC